MAGFSIHIEGMAEVGDTLRKLPLAVKERVAKSAMYAAATVGRDAVQTEVPIGGTYTYRQQVVRDPHPGNILRNLRIAKAKKVPDTVVQYRVFVHSGPIRRGKGWRGRMLEVIPPYYWSMVEFGTSKMKANPFMTRGFLKSVNNAANRARDVAKARAMQYLKKNAL